MNTRDIAKLACRLLALYFTASVLISVPWLFSSFLYVDEFRGSSTPLATFTLTAAIFLGQLFVTTVLWLGAARFSRWIVPEPSDIDFGGLSLETAQRLAFSTVGLVFALQGGAALIEQGVLSLNPALNAGTSWGAVTGSVVRLLLGALLLVGVRGLTRSLNGLMRNRIPQDAQNSEKEV